MVRNRVGKLEFKHTKKPRGLAHKGLKKKCFFEIAQNQSKHLYNWFGVK